MKPVNEILFRASSMGVLMTEARSKTELLGETCKSKLIDIYVEQCEDRREEINSKYIEKGLAREEMGIDLYSLHTGKIHFKNGMRLSNKFVTGHADMLVHDELENVIDIPDIKNSWNRNTYLKQIAKGVTKSNYWQGQTYCWLYDSPKATMVYTLVNATLGLINDAKYYAARELNLIDLESHPSGKEAAMQIERNMIFDMDLFLKEYRTPQLVTPLSDWNFDIPASRRIKELPIERNETDIQEIQNRVPVWRKWIADNLYPTL